LIQKLARISGIKALFKLWILWAHPRAYGAGTGLSAPIFCLRQKYFRFYPLRFAVRKVLRRGRQATFSLLPGYEEFAALRA
jgi:hypothetical protein